MQSAHAVFECTSCRLRREVTIADDGSSKALPDDQQERAKRIGELLRHATCPACQARDPRAIAAHRRSVWRGKLSMAAFYIGLAFLSYVVRWFAVVPPILIMLIWSIGLKVRIRRRYWFPIVSELVIAASMIAWIIVEPTRAYVVPAVVALLALLPFRTSSDPFADAAEQLRFAESPYRG